MKRNWRNQIREGFVQSLKINEIYNEKSKFTFNLYIYLKCLPVDVYVDAMMQAVQSLIEYSGGYSPSLKVLYRILGDKIHQR